jgi:hypothetical protein
VTLSTGRWLQQLELVPGSTTRVSVPSKEGELFVPLAVTSASGFVPAEVEGNSDRRLLGAWIEFTPDDTSKTSTNP